MMTWYGLSVIVDVLTGWNVKQRMEYLETHWAYFLGFGLPLALATNYTSFLVTFGHLGSRLSHHNRHSRAGLFALFFPWFIITAVAATPVVSYGLCSSACMHLIP